MPIYEYECQACEHVFDVLQKMSDDPLTYCPECGEQKLRKLLSAPNFRLKGGGWYETDFKNKNKRNLAGSADSGTGDKSATKTEAKGSGTSESGAKTAETKNSASTDKSADS